jgi:hypothetical protein
MSPYYPRVRIHGPSGNALVRDLVRIVFFLPHDHHQLTAGVAHALDSYVRAIEGRPGALSRYTCCWWEPYELTSTGWQRIQETLAPGEPRFFDDYEPDEAFYPEKEGADPYFTLFGEQGNGYSFSYHARLPWREPPPHSVSVLTATLPTEYLEETGASHVRELALTMASRLPFATGHAGLALDLWHPLHEQLSRLRTELFRYPGFDVRRATLHDNVGTRVDGIHWLNFLGPPVLSELGGARGLRACLQSPSTTVLELEGDRVVVTLGESPEAGDTIQGQTLPTYRELARVLEPWQEPFPWAWLSRHDRGTDADELRRWWRRFLD